jgi:hypothetical protein
MEKIVDVLKFCSNVLQCMPWFPVFIQHQWKGTAHDMLRTASAEDILSKA